MIQLLMDICIASTFWLLLWTWVYTYLFEHLFFQFCWVCLEVELLDHIILCLAFWRTAELFSTLATSFYIPTNSAKRFQFLQVFTTILLFSFFFLTVTILMSTTWHLTVVLICIFSCAYQSSVYLLLRNVFCPFLTLGEIIFLIIMMTIAVKIIIHNSIIE